MQDMRDWLAFVVVDPVKAMLMKVWGYVPSLFAAIIILVVGWLIAKVIEAVIIRVLKAVRLDMASEKAGITNVLAQGDIKLSISELFGALVYWLIILVVLATALNALNLTIAANLLSRLAEYVPNILAALFVLVAGSFLASFVSAIVRTATSNAGIGTAKMLGKIVHTIIVIFSVLVAIEQLNIATAIIGLGINIILMSFGIGLALAFGLGCKDIAGKAMQDFLNSVKK